jgi:hypothetical protein
MNNRQSILIGIAMTLLILTGLFPPWRTIRSKGHRPGPYSYIWRPPSDSFEVDTTRLGVEWVLIVSISGALLLLFRKKQPERRGKVIGEGPLPDRLERLTKENQQLATQLAEARRRHAQARQTLMDKYEVEQSQIEDIFGH